MMAFQTAWKRILLIALLTGFTCAAQAATDLPVAAGSPTAGITFDDHPLLLPVQRNFQMAMLTTSSELGRSCGHMEAYGWRMAAGEQQRVNQIFNNTVDRLRAQGFVVEAKTPNAVSSDVTVYTADRPDKHLITMWSAGEIGLVLVMCETSAPMNLRGDTALKNGEPLAITPFAAAQPQTSRIGTPIDRDFSPVGDWVGGYTCTQGSTGATLHISKMKGDQFEGVFRFYPTPKNPYVPSGRYKVFGEYDRETQRILVNPGEWLSRPKDYYNTIMIGSFDAVEKTFSAYFQGVTGCTSFEAHYAHDSADISDEVFEKAVKKNKELTKDKKAKKKVVKKKAAKKKTSPAKAEATPKAAPVTELSVISFEEPKAPAPDSKGIAVGDTPAAAAASAPATPEPAVTFVPAEAPKNLNDQVKDQPAAAPAKEETKPVSEAKPAEPLPEKAASSPETGSAAFPGPEATSLLPPLALEEDKADKK